MALPDNSHSPKRFAIMEAATELFAARGYGAVSMDAIAKAADVSKATLYAHFESKDRLFATIVNVACQQNIGPSGELPSGGLPGGDWFGGDSPVPAAAGEATPDEVPPDRVCPERKPPDEASPESADKVAPTWASERVSPDTVRLMGAPLFSAQPTGATPLGADGQACDVEVALREIGGRILRFFLRDRTLALHRLVIAESIRFPELGRAFYENGPAAGRRMLGAWMARQPALIVPDPELAAEQFLGLIRSGLYLRATLGLAPHPDEAAIDTVVTASVRTFLRAFTTR